MSFAVRSYLCKLKPLCITAATHSTLQRLGSKVPPFSRSATRRHFVSTDPMSAQLCKLHHGKNVLLESLGFGLKQQLPASRITGTTVFSRRPLLKRPLSSHYRLTSTCCSGSSAATSAVTETPTQAASHTGNGTDAAFPNSITYQDAIARLQSYWASVGCAIGQPHNSQVGAGTLNPLTFLRAGGPEPWKVVYVEPSVRPDDSRYGENPNRLSTHTQLQVILKPDPGNPLELYLASLEALGIDTKAHDVRFVEDNWESPVLGAWGLGWEVWLDGMEVTQFTYFQQAGGQPLEAPSVEITYGLERIIMVLQGVKHFKDIRYNDTLSYGEMFLQSELEWSFYNLEDADIESQRHRFEIYEKEARRMIEKRLPLPAYQHLLQLSHAFNVLDSRGAVGVSERQACFAVLRSLARQITALWVERRGELDFPLGRVPPLPVLEAQKPLPGPTVPTDFVLEIGCEELPPDDVESALSQLREKFPALLKKLRLEHGAVRVEGTPRRLAVLVSDLAPGQPDVEEAVKGPPAKVAFGADGAPSKALAGFCAKNGVTPEETSIKADAKGVNYIWAIRKQAGRSAAEVLTEDLGGLVSSLAFPRVMRWNGETAFSRPVRWLMALHGSTVLPFFWGGLRAGSSTQLLRNSPAPTKPLASADEYRQALEAAGIRLEVESRAEGIWQEACAAAASLGGRVPESARDGLLGEVTQLVEAPTVLLGSFNPDFLALPREVLVMVMRKHQRYFPVTQPDSDELLPHFVAVPNGPIHIPTVRAGNEAVLQARFEDAQFFYTADLATTLEDFRPQLAGMVFQKDLGTMLDKAQRVEALIAPLAQAAGLTEAAGVATAAAHLSRADLATAIVTEMTALAGTMGRHYALREGQSPEIAEAIWESVLPRTAGDELPKTPAGLLVAVADRLDSLVGLTAVGCAPTASSDPYGLRRSAYGMLEALVANGVRLDSPLAISAAAELQRDPVPEGTNAAVADFVARRLEQLLVDGGCAVHGVRAVLGPRGRDPTLAATSARELQEELSAGEASPLGRVMAAMSRPTRLVRGKNIDAGWRVRPELSQHPEETALLEAYKVAAAATHPDMAIRDFLQVAGGLVQPLDAYFEKVFVMCEEEDVRNSRLALLRDIASLTDGIIDFSQLPGF